MSYYNNNGSATDAGGGTVEIAPNSSTLSVQSGTWTVALAGGTTLAASQSGTWTVSLAANQDVNALPAAAVSGGTKPEPVISLATTNATLVKNTAANLYGFVLGNTSASWRYLKLFNKATAPVPGSDTPVAVIGLPPGANATHAFPVGMSFALGLGFAITANPALNDTTAIAANDIVGTMEFA